LKRITSVLGKKVLIADGVLGTFIQQSVEGLCMPDEANLTHPALVERLLNDYSACGADFISTNTFGSSQIKLKDVGMDKQFKKINTEATVIARRVADARGIWVAGDIGPTGKLLEPLGELSFDDAVKNFSAQAALLESCGVDFILVETIPEIQEFRAAAVGILSTVKIPVMMTMAFPNDHHSLTGTDGGTFAVTSEFAGLAAVGSNCGTSLENMKVVMEQMGRYTPLPLICQPNAGLPSMENGKPVFKVKADEFADFMEDIYQMGGAVLGACCGSTPEFTCQLAKKFKNKPVIKRNINNELALSSRTGMKTISREKIFVVGERINPTGRKKLQKELEAGKLTTIRSDARKQEKIGCDALDININLPDMKSETVYDILKCVGSAVNIPLVIDSTDPAIIETFARLYAGKGVINSISGESGSMNALLPLVRKYNMAFIAVLMDDDGIPDSVEKRIKIAGKIVEKALDMNIPQKNIIFDPLVLSAGAEVEQVPVTLETIGELKEKFPDNKILMGLSNISFGLPNRELVNTTFLSLAAARGLDMVIANLLQESVRDQLMTVDFLRTGSRENLVRYTGHFASFQPREKNSKPAPPELPRETSVHHGESLEERILTGDIDGARENVNALLQSEAPLQIIENHVIPAMNEVGRRYREKEYFLPQLMASADVVKEILPDIKSMLPETGENGSIQQDKIMIATVKGDVHDIGKNIVAGILESFNYTVIDLGKDVPVETIVSEAVKHNVRVIGLSALMTTTLPALFETVEAIKNENRLGHVKIFIGGAVVNRKIAEEVGVYYCPDGMGMVNTLKWESKHGLGS
jgi:5-methyltetrahydrofolate--homocysteine methyltransferase